MDMTGELDGANAWEGLRREVGVEGKRVWADAGFTGHSCDTCRQDVEVDGSVHSVQAAVVDGITATRHPKCAVHGCKWDLPGLGGER